MRERLIPGLIIFFLSLAIPHVAAGQEQKDEKKPEKTFDIPELPESKNLDVPKDLKPEVAKAWETAWKAYDEAYQNRGNPKARTSELWEKAIKELQKVRRKDRKFMLPCYYLGIAYQLVRDFKDAKRYMEKALEMQDDFHEAMVELGDIYFWMRDWDKAVEWYDKALAIRPDYPYGYQRRCAALCRLREFDKALEDAQIWDFLERRMLKKEQEKTKEKKEPEGKRYSEAVLEMVEKEAAGYDFDPKYTVKSDHYIVISNHSQEAAEFISEEVEKIFRTYDNLFVKMDKGADRFPVIVFKDRQDYFAYGGREGTAGYYSPYVRKLVFFWEGGPRFSKVDLLMVLRHEAFHQYLHYYLELAPQWFNEGMADFFGATVEVEEGTGKKKEKGFKPIENWWRLEHIKGAIKAGRYTNLEKLMTMTQQQMYGTNVGLNYAQAWSIIYFMWNYPTDDLRGKYLPVLMRYFKELRNGKWLKGAYEASFGKIDMDKFEEEWKTYTLLRTAKKPSPPKD